MTIPQGYLPVMPYILVKDAYTFIDLMKEVFNAEVQYLQERSEGIIMHAELRIEQAVIMLCDATEEYPAFPGSNFLYLSNADEVFDKANGKGLAILQPLEDRPYGRGFGFSDGFGNTWWVNTPIEK